jgi:glucosamine-phosphate N-acetyltransferase
MKFRALQSSDYSADYFKLLGQLTIVNATSITQSAFCTFVDSLSNSHQIIVVENDNKQIVASGTIFIESKIIHGLGKVGHIEDIVVDKSTQGMGLGKALLVHLSNIAKFENCYKVILNCKQLNCAFYEKCGFKQQDCEMTKRFNI